MNIDIIIASNNLGKIKEFKTILEPMGYHILSLNEAGLNIDIEETGITYEENATLKAEEIYKLKHKPVIADDSGIEIDYLNGEPGVFSARYKGIPTSEGKIEYILNKMQSVPEDKRTARFVCSLCYINQDGEKIVVDGIWNGRITQKVHNGNGFGYDPIFKPEGGEITASEMSEDEKNSKSHRGIAIQKLLEKMSDSKNGV